jgi:epoxyqueuosine reductase
MLIFNINPFLPLYRLFFLQWQPCCKYCFVCTKMVLLACIGVGIMKHEQTECLKRELIRLLLDGGAMLAGVADLTTAYDAIATCADRRLLPFPRAVSFAVAFPRSVIDELTHGPSHTYLHYYRAVNTLIDELSLRLTTAIEVRGFRAFPVPSSQRTGKHRLDSIFPHRVAAYLAGLGWIGKSGCLVNEKVGPRLRLGTVLTDAMLPPESPAAILCGDCTACRDACPAGAIKGRLFSPDVPLLERLDPSLCDTYQDKVRDRFGKRVCGLCLAACPFGRIDSQPGDSQE